MDFHFQETQILLNPRQPTEERVVLEELAARYPLKDHFWIASSGTSTHRESSVKLMALSRSAILASAEAVNRHLQANESDVWAQCLPSFHVGGVGVEARAFLTGSKVVTAFGKWDPQGFYDLLRENKVSLTAMVPAQVFDLTQRRLSAPPSLRAVVVGGAALAQDLYEEALSLGWPLLPSFGMTECCSQIATAELDSWKEKKRELKILSHITARISGDGYLEVKTPSLLTGYAQMENGNSFFQDPKVEGWLKTTDQVEIQQNFLIPQGRGSDFIKILGEGVNLFKLQERWESLNSGSPYSQEVALVAIPEPRRGHQLCLVATRDVPGTWLEEMILKFNQMGAPFEKIHETKRVQQIPRTVLGKIIREDLLSLLRNF